MRRSAERTRRRLQAVGAALATWFLLGAAGVLALHGQLDRHLGPISDPGTRGGTAFAFCLLVLPVAAFLHQTGRLATADRERRLAALRLAGATPRQVRLLGTLETTRSGVAGALAGAVVFLPVWWAVLPGPGISPVLCVAAMVLVVLVSALSGLLAGRHVVATPLGVTRRARRGRPNPYGLVVVALALLLRASAWLGYLVGHTVLPEPYGLVIQISPLVVAIGLMLSASRLVWFFARVTGRRARSAVTLLAARTLEADARPWGRAMSLVGLAVTIGSATGWMEEGIISERHGLEPFWMTSFILVDAALLVAITVAAAALLVHQAEYLLENGTVLADLHAAGTSEHDLRRVLVRQALIASAPICAIGALTGLVAMLDLSPGHWYWKLWPLANALIVAGLGVLGAVLAGVSSRRRLRRAITPERLRTA